MITDTEVKAFESLRQGSLASVPEGDKSILHNQWLVLEVPLAEIDTTRTWKGKVQPDVRLWRYTLLPEGGGESAVVLRSEGKIRLVGETVEASIQAELHSLLKDIFESTPQYRVYGGAREDGSPPAVAILRDGKVVGAVAQYVEDVKEGWLTF